MVDAGEQLNVTLKREFGEEALNSIDVSENKKDSIKHHVDQLFQHGTEVKCVCLWNQFYHRSLVTLDFQ